MSDIGIRELKTHASEIVRRVSEDGQGYIVTRHGRPRLLSFRSKTFRLDRTISAGSLPGTSWVSRLARPGNPPKPAPRFSPIYADPDLARRFALTLGRLPHLTLVPLDHLLAR
jgi:antitoxin (DNA-binding transcriptional repressor) of toxin-antitoxin stability system